jgi:2-polyprenyl-3-methyl-5-hydroxy-6-metoxy-1,4-benzoquinol methylase
VEASTFHPVVPARAACKCCGSEAALFGVVDFSKNCEDRRRPALELSGIPIYYHRCPKCGFLFTTAFDSFSHEDFARHIYNADYQRVDPDFAVARPAASAEWMTLNFARSRPSRILDYGGGKGALAKLLREAGFSNVENYDPFVPEFAVRPEGKFDCILCFEVMEHSPRPAETLAEVASFLANPGIVFFSTAVQPESIMVERVGWWYVAPRNGHVSIFTTTSLEILAAAQGLQYGLFRNGTHAVCKEIPVFFQHLVPGQK